MNWKAILKIAFDALMRNRIRSLLTMLGVIIGVAAVIVTVAIGTGARVSVQQRIESLGSNLVYIVPGSVTTNGARTGAGGVSTLTVADGLAIAKLPNVAAVSPLVQTRMQVISGGQNWQTSIYGVSPTYTFIRSWPLASGTFFSQSDVTTVAKVAVLGQTVVNNLFPDGSSPLGKTILINGIPFTVIGTLTSLGQGGGFGQDQDDVIMMPYTSVMQRLSGTTTLQTLLASASDTDHINSVQAAITALLEERHRIVPPQADDFMVENTQQFANAAEQSASIMEILLASVAAVSLIVGGIGIMNIMMVSVTERTREIGLRMALGARSGAILQQFLAEAIVLATAGGIIGLGLGAIGTVLVSLLAKWPTIIPLEWVALSVLFSAFVGIFFGYYPARKAAMLNPIDALRFE